jgi:hypothetical protein
MRVLLVWRETFEATRDAGLRLFGDRYMLLRNEDLRADPGSALGRVYGMLGRKAPDEVVAWASSHVRAPEPPFAGDDPRWAQELERAGLSEALAQAGYSVDPAATLD